MTALAGAPSYPAVKFSTPGDSVAGRILDFNDSQVRDFATGDPKFWDDGKPMMQTRITLELADDSKVSLYVKPGRMMKAVREALKAAGALDIDEDATITAEFTGYDPESKNKANPAKLFKVTYEPFEPPL